MRVRSDHIRVLKIMAVFLGLALVLAGQVFFKGSALAQGTLPTVRMGTYSGGMAGFMSHVIKAYKLDEKNGINIDTRPMAPVQLYTGVAYKRLEVGLLPIISAAMSTLEGNEVKIIGPTIYNGGMVMVKKESPYKKLSELYGKKFAIYPRIMSTTQHFQMLLQLQGVDMDKNFQLFEGKTHDILMAILQRGEVEGILLHEPLVTKMIAEGFFREIARLNDMWLELRGQPLLSTALATHSDWLKENRENARKVFQSVMDSLRYIKARPEVFEEQRSYFGNPDDAQVRLLRERLPNLYPDRWDEKIVAEGKYQLELAVKLGMLKEMPKGDIFVILK